MADETAENAENADTPPAPRTSNPLGCVLWLFVGFFLSGFVGMGLAFWAIQNNADELTVVAAFFGPPLAFFAIFGFVAVPRFIQQVREAARNAPSPESAAAIAHGEGVEAGTPAKSVEVPEIEGFPTVHLADTFPGKVFAHTLIRDGLAPGCQFGCSLVFTLLWNGILSVFVYQAFAKWNQGGGFRWFETLILVPFVLVGLFLIGVSLLAGLKWFVSGWVGRVDVELETHPLTPGGRFRLHVAQTGMVPLRRVTLALICTEAATYVAGTSKSTATKVVVRHAISKPDEDAVGEGLPLTVEFTVPANAMHSFEAPNNTIKWTVRVIGSVFGFLPFTEDYSLTVSPEPALSSSGEPSAQATGLG